MADATPSDSGFDPSSVDLRDMSPDLHRQVICFLELGDSDFDGRLGLRISALFVILVTSSLTTFFPVVASRIRFLRIPLYVYLFARYFGAGVIIATAFVHLLNPAYEQIGPASCVGLTGGWRDYPWPSAIAMTSAMLIFLMDFSAEWYVEHNFGLEHDHVSIEATITDNKGRQASDQAQEIHHSHQFLHSGDQGDSHEQAHGSHTVHEKDEKEPVEVKRDVELVRSRAAVVAIERAFRSQIAAFLILEFGVLFHSVIIGLNLGASGAEFNTLYPVIVFHQAFEGLGIGARLSVIPFPSRFSWLPWTFCTIYAVTTPIAIATGIVLSNNYNSGSFAASLVSGVLDAVSAGILLYTGFVELLARDFLFNPDRTRDPCRIFFMLFCLFLGSILMALLGKWT